MTPRSAHPEQASARKKYSCTMQPAKEMRRNSGAARLSGILGTVTEMYHTSRKDSC